jgi:Anti-sigma-K factor rskA
VTERHDPPPLRDLVEDGLPKEVLAELERVDALLRSVPALPELPPALRGVAAPAPRKRGRAFTLGRFALGLAAVAAVAVGFFALGTWIGGDEFDARAAVPMVATKHAEGAWGMLHLGPVNAEGNQTIRLEVSGLPKLPDGAYYFLWLAKDDEYAAPCGTFAVGAGDTTAEWTVSYRIDEYDAWVVTARMPGAQNGDAPWLLQASIET